jgi:DNA primase
MTAEELLQEKGIHYQLSGKDAKVKCLNPEHDDSNPSMRVDRVTGVFNCFSCGFKGNLFTYYGAPSSPLEVRLHRIREGITKVKSQTVGIQLPKERIRWAGGPLRNISEETLQIWDAFTWNTPKFEGRIVFPIRNITGKTVALIGRLISEAGMGQSKYYIYPGGAEMPFCPAKVKPIQNRVILVEGIFDALNLWDKGLKNTVCCFGTQQVNWVKLSLLKMQGVQGVDIMFDGDEAGSRASEAAKGLAEKLDMSARIVTLPLNTDPGNLNRDQIERLKKKLYGE